MVLPYSDELHIEYLSRLFDNTSECYKFFWFKAILEKVIAGTNEISFEKPGLPIEMLRGFVSS